MTHSLHRRGTEESLKDDFVLLVTSAYGFNHVGSKDKMRKILDEVFELEPCNIGSYDTGTILSGVDIQEIRDALNDVPRVRCCFSSKEKMKKVLQRIKELDLGLSVTVSGLTDEVLDMARELDIKPHCVNLSLEIWGNVEKLPSEEVLELVTMCGHGLISSGLVEDCIEKVKKGHMTPRDAAVKISHPCVCGIYNPDRAEKLLEKYVPQKEQEMA
ncbi:MAG: hypothetical protein PWQ67_624 [Clostridia bacterium]|jgi:hypothetical protein|nr:hypothetical protein [Clostridia bacterium]MDN5322170.1 hypothetical protein [Clostridia bacterium]